MSTERSNILQEPGVALLRFGLLLDDFILRDWQWLCLEKLVSDPRIELSCVILHGGVYHPSSGIRLSRPRSSIQQRRGFRFYRKYVSPSRATELRDRSAHLTKAPKITATTYQTGPFSEAVNPETCALLRSLHLDFLLRFGFDVLRGEILDAARCGVWSFHHGDEREYRGLPPCFWEMYDGRKSAGAILQRLTPRLDAGIVLRRGFFEIDQSSYGRTLDRVLYSSAVWPYQVCCDLLADKDALNSCHESRTKAKIRKAPSMPTLVWFGMRQVARAIQRSIRNIFVRPDWQLAATCSTPDALANGKTSHPWVALTQKNAHKYWADPFVIEAAGRTYLFCEEYDFRTAKGSIVCGEIAGDRISWLGRPFQDLDDHASFPQLLQTEQGLFATLETHKRGEVLLYRCVDFPLHWRCETVLLSGFPALDPVVFQSEGLWWLACTDGNRGPTHDLHLFWATSLIGPYSAHRLNPVKSDLSSARPAGLPFIWKNTLVRPTQDARNGYGSGVTLCQVELLNRDRFHERVIGEICPALFGQHFRGLHSLTQAGRRTFLDLKTYVTTPREMMHAWRVRRSKLRPGINNV